MIENEKRLHRCCFTGHRPEKLSVSERDAKVMLEKEIRLAIADGFNVFITGMAPGVDIWAAEVVLELKNEFPLKLIAASPHPVLRTDGRWIGKSDMLRLWTKPILLKRYVRIIVVAVIKSGTSGWWITLQGLLPFGMAAPVEQKTLSFMPKEKVFLSSIY